MQVDPGGRTTLGQILVDLAGICRALSNVAASARGGALIDGLRVTVSGSMTEILWQALFADCLRVVHGAAMADGVIEDREIDALYELIAAAARHYGAGFHPHYAEIAVVDRESAREFLDRYAADHGAFGQGARLRWPGLTLCRRAAELGEREALQRYRKMMTTMCAEAGRLDGGLAGAPRPGGEGDQLGELRRLLDSEIGPAAPVVDRRVQAFLAPCRVFSAVQQASSIFENDPFDVEAVHSDARLSFEQLVAHAMMRPQVADVGKMLVVLGDSGSGKTHLLRGFRRYVQEGNRGFVVYAQLQSRTEDYTRYLLLHLVDSLSRRYSEQSGRTGLRELAGGLARLAGPPLRKRMERLAEGTWGGRGNLADHINELVGELLALPELESVDPDLLRVLLYALRPDPWTTSSVYKYLRCEDLNAHDRHFIGDVAPHTRDDDPHWMIRDLSRVAAVTQRALVVMVDQVDLAGFEADSTKIFRRAIDALYWIVSEIPSAVAVVACLSDLYSAARSDLNRPALDRLESAPPIARLEVNRSYSEIEAVVARRLAWLFAEHGTVHRPEQPVYPIPESELRHLENRRLRDVLEWCHQFQAQCAAAGKIINADEPVTIEVNYRERDLDAIAAAWSDANQATGLEVPNEEDEILAVIAEAAKAYVQEMGFSLGAALQNDLLRLQMSRGEDLAALAIAVVNSSYQGGAFTNQIESLRRRARGMVPIAVRTLEFPRGRACDKALGQLNNMRGRQAVLDVATLRALVAFKRFAPPFAADRIVAWRMRDRPISSLPRLIEIFDFDRSRVDPSVGAGHRASSVPPDAPRTREAPVDAPSAVGGAASGLGGFRVQVAQTAEITDAIADPTGRTAALGSKQEAAPLTRSAADATRTSNGSREPSAQHGPPSSKPGDRSAVVGPTIPRGEIWIGNSTSFESEPVLLDVATLLRHVAVVDSVGAGRLASALSIIEQMLERGLPAIVLDRTGEMSGYARPEWWQDSEDTQRARQLAERIEVRLFTPGIRGGRPLAASLIPDLSRVAPADRARRLEAAARALAAMLPAAASTDEPGRTALLGRAISLLAARSTPGGLVELIEAIETGGEELAACADDALRHGVMEDLAALLGNADVFTPTAEPLTMATLIGGAAAGRVPLAILNTSFLGEGPRLRSWLGQLCECLTRELPPSNALQAMFVLDGADLFLPAGAGKAPAREPLAVLLKRAASAGLGLVLTSQRPGEVDYRRCAAMETWFVGRTEDQVLERMKPLFDRRPLGHRNLARLEPGRFVMLHDGGARDVQRRSPMIRLDRIPEGELKLLAAKTHPRARDSQRARRADTASEPMPPPSQPSRVAP